jgi:4-hydroxy-tetrahydrodipicolinate synthase
LQNGAAGCISGLGNAMPDVLSGILDAFNAGDIAEAERQQAIYTAFRTELYALGFPPALVKRSLYLTDPSVGASRQPALLPSEAQDAQIREILNKYKLA